MKQKKLTQRLRPLFSFFDEMGQKNVSVLAAGIAYFSLLGTFPAVAAGVAMTLFVIRPEHVQLVVAGIDPYVPHEITRLLGAQLRSQAGHGSNLIMALVALIIALFSASGAIENTMKALNMVYERKETRSWWRQKSNSVLLTAGVILQFAIVTGLLFLSSAQLGVWGVSFWLAAAISILRWVVILCIINATFLMLYYYGANRERARFHLATPGSISATFLWLTATLGMSWYIQHFANFGTTYGFLAGVIILLLWFNLSALVLLMGALIDKRQER